MRDTFLLNCIKILKKRFNILRNFCDIRWEMYSQMCRKGASRPLCGVALSFDCTKNFKARLETLFLIIGEIFCTVLQKIL